MTYLMWQDIPENKGVILTWDEAKEYCEMLDQDGYDDWWLPSESELSTIVDLDRPQGRRIQTGFRHYKPGAYWTSSTYAWNAPDAWVISFRDGSSFTEEKEERRFFRCVRCSDLQECITRFYEKNRVMSFNTVRSSLLIKMCMRHFGPFFKSVSNSSQVDNTYTA